MTTSQWEEALRHLTAQVPPPPSPVRADGDWDEFAARNSLVPPSDYRTLIRRYGAGSFGGWLRLIEPFHPAFPFITAAELECRDLLGVQRQFPQFYPAWPIWPDAGGLLPWAVTATGDHIGWRTEGDPDAWTTLIWTRDGDDSSEYPVGAVSFLLGLVEGRFGDPAFEYKDADPTLEDSRTHFRPAPLQAPEPPLLGSALVRYAATPDRHPAFDEAVREAFGSLTAGRGAGIVLRSYGTVGTVPGEVHHNLSVGFDLQEERTAKELALQVGRAISTPIVEVLDAAHSPDWPDIIGRP